MHRDEAADRHWAAVSHQTQLAGRHRSARRAAARRGARRRLGLTLVRTGLRIAPLRVKDITECA